MISILPKLEIGENCVMVAYNTIVITPIYRFIEFRERKKSVRTQRFGLRRKVTKQLFAIVNRAIAISVKS